MFDKNDCPYKDDRNSQLWLKYGELNPRMEGVLTLIQDRCFYIRNRKNCPHCTVAKLNVPHVATCCKNLLKCYTKRHDEVLRCIHMNLCKEYKFSENNKIKLHQITKVIENNYAKIITDMNIKVNKNIKENRPDIVVFDKLKRKIKIIEVGITSKNNLQKQESFKKHKYIELGNELSLMHRMQVEIIPFVMTWDGMVTRFNKEYRNSIGIEDKTLAYIQGVSLKKTLELLINDTIRFDSTKNKDNYEIEEMMNKIEVEDVINDKDVDYYEEGGVIQK